MALDKEGSDNQLALLAAHRRTLMHLLRQAAIFGLFTPPYVAHGIEEARAAITQLKVHLHNAGVAVGDVPGDLPGTTPIERRARQLRFLNVLIIVVVLVIVVLAASGGVVGLWAQLDEWGIVPAVQPEQPGETLLVIAPFYYTEGTIHTEGHREIARAIQAEAKKDGLTNLRVAVAAASLRSDDRDRAEQIGARYNASLVVWGDDTGVRVTVNFLNRRGTPKIAVQDVTISETVRTQIAAPAAYNRFVTNDLPHKLSFLALFAVGQSFYVKQDYDRAIRVIQEAVDAAGSGMSVDGLDDAYFRLGWLYQEPKHNTTQAVEMYSRAIAISNKNPLAYNNRGTAYYVQKDWKNALDDYNQAITAGFKNTVAYTNRGNARSKLNDFMGALEDYNQAIALDSKYAPAYSNRGVVREELRDLKGAFEDYNRAIALDPKYAPAYYNRGLTRHKLNDLQAAIEDYNQAIALDPNYVLAYINRGAAHHKLNDLQAAIGDYNQAIGLDPKYAPAYYYRGLVRHKLNDLQGAIGDYNQAIGLDPKYAPAYYYRGLVRVAQSDSGGAVADFEQVLQLTNDVDLHSQAEEKLRELQK